MARQKTDHVAQDIYSAHLYGSRKRFAHNPTNNRYAVLNRMYVRVLTELAVNRFKYTNMPDSVDVRYMELTLFYSALSVFFKDPDTDKYLALAGGGNGSVNMVDQHVSFLVTGPGFEGKTFSAVTVGDDKAECVPIWANYLRVPDLDIVYIYAHKLADLDQTIEINSHNARRNKIVATDENTRLSYENINRQIDEGQPTIRVARQLGQEITALDLGINPDSIEKLSILRARIWNECMGLLGINNANQDKKERLVSSEVDANDDQVDSQKHVNLNERKVALDKINKRWGLNISVDYNTSVDEQAASVVNTSESEDKPNE